MGADEPQEIRRAVSGAAAVAIRDIVSKNPVAAGHFDGREATEVVARGDVTIVYFGDEWTSATMPRWIEGVPEIRALAGLPPVSATDDPELTALRAARRRRHEPEAAGHAPDFSPPAAPEPDPALTVADLRRADGPGPVDVAEALEDLRGLEGGLNSDCVIVEKGERFIVERPAARGNYKVSRPSGATIGFVAPTGKVRRVGNWETYEETAPAAPEVKAADHEPPAGASPLEIVVRRDIKPQNRTHRCGEHLTDEQIGESQERALPLCESRPVAWRTSVAAAVLSNGTRIACVGRTEAEAETMRRAAESQKEPR